MGIADKFGNAAEDTKGQAKEAAGKLTDDPQLEADGKMDQMKATVKEKFEDVKDAVADTFNKITDKD